MPIRLRNGKWYLKKKVKGKFIGLALGYGPKDTAKALIKAGQILEQLERGEEPAQLKSKFEKFVPKYWERFEKRKAKHRTEEIRVRNESIIRKHLIPWFGEKRMEEIDSKVVFKYIHHREKPVQQKTRTVPGAAMSTLIKELRVLKDFMLIGNPKWELPEIEYKNKGKTQERALTYEEILYVQLFIRNQSENLGKQYELIYQIMALTSLDIGDVLSLKRSEINLADGIIKTSRGKTGIFPKIPIGKLLKPVLEETLKVTHISGRLFLGIGGPQVSVAIGRAFRDAGLGQFSAKSLRHFWPSLLGNEGASETVIGKILGHAKGSRCTSTYIHAYDSKLKEAVEILDRQGDQTILRIGRGRP